MMAIYSISKKNVRRHNSRLYEIRAVIESILCCLSALLRLDKKRRVDNV